MGGDITYLKTPEGWLYLAAVLDLFSRFVVGWAVSSVIDRHLVLKALEMVQKRRGNSAGRLFHSDRGNQYASEDYRKAPVDGGFICSMSRKGNCHDKAVNESWFSISRQSSASASTVTPRRTGNSSSTSRFCFNQQRSHSTLGDISPAEFERNAAA